MGHDARRRGDHPLHDAQRQGRRSEDLEFRGGDRLRDDARPRRPHGRRGARLQTPRRLLLRRGRLGQERRPLRQPHRIGTHDHRRQRILAGGQQRPQPPARRHEEFRQPSLGKPCRYQPRRHVAPVGGRRPELPRRAERRSRIRFRRRQCPGDHLPRQDGQDDGREPHEPRLFQSRGRRKRFDPRPRTAPEQLEGARNERQANSDREIARRSGHSGPSAPASARSSTISAISRGTTILLSSTGGSPTSWARSANCAKKARGAA